MAVTVGIVFIGLLAALIAYGIGYQQGQAAGDERAEFEREQRLRELSRNITLAHEIEKHVAAAQPQLRGGGNVTPFRTRKNRDAL